MWLMAAPAPQMGEEGRQRSLSSLAGWRLFLWERWPELGRHSLLRQGYLARGGCPKANRGGEGERTAPRTGETDLREFRGEGCRGIPPSL